MASDEWLETAILQGFKKLTLDQDDRSRAENGIAIQQPVRQPRHTIPTWRET